MFTFHRLVLVGLVALGGIAHAPAAAAQEQGVSVTVQYKGKGTVDASHRVWVWLFDTPDIGPASMPIDEQAIDKNGGTATFSGVTAKQVYIAVAYDEGGGFMGQAAPPSGSPIAIYGQKGAEDPPQPVVPGAKGKVTIVLTDAQRMP